MAYLVSLRYKGKPDLGANRQVDDLADLCFCKFIAVGEPLDGRLCKSHGTYTYKCGQCSCSNYRPNRPKESPGHHPSCVCGHIAQEHN